jgi:hypothetical protein
MSLPRPDEIDMGDANQTEDQNRLERRTPDKTGDPGEQTKEQSEGYRCHLNSSLVACRAQPAESGAFSTGTKVTLVSDARPDHLFQTDSVKLVAERLLQ